MKLRCGFFGTLIWIHGFVLFSAFCLVSGKVISDRGILIEFRNSVSDLTGILSSWNSNVSDHCSWYGVSCNSKSRVLEIKITGGNNSCSSLVQKFPFYRFGLRRNRACGSCSSGTLVGKLTPLIGRLSELRVLSLPFNEFSGEIPIEVWGLENLEVLDLEGNLFTGKLPRRFKGLRKLQVFNLGFNQIEGKIPISLMECKDLYLSNNHLTGYISDEYGIHCRNLEHLDLSGNLLFGGMPRGLGKCLQLRTLRLNANKFDGVIPREFGQLQKLEVLDVSRNNLSGSLPVELGNCVELSVLVLSNLFDPVSGVSILSYENNCFQGSVPMEITTLPKLKVVWAPRAMLQGKIPSNWGKCDGLEMVNLAENFFHGDLSEAFGGCKNLHFLNLSSNRLTGELDEKLLVPCMTIFDASKNSLSGSIPNFSDNICPHNYSNNADKLSFAYIFFFTPQSVANLGSLVLLDLSKNKLQGQIPRNLAQLKYLKYLSLSGNNLTGVIPSSFELLQSLEVLALSSNFLTGEIPQSLMNLRNLTVLLLNNNNLSGQIPSGLANLTSLLIFNASWNNLSEPLSLKNDVMNNFHRFTRLLSVSNTNGSVVYSLNDETSTVNVTSSWNSGLTSIEIASVVSASAIFSVLLALIVLYFYTRKWAPNSRVQVSESREITVFIDIGVPLTYDSIVRSTGFFNASNCIGFGGFGATYKAEINSQTLLAVKKLSVGRFQGVQQFHAEIKTLETVRHPNLVKLIGYHASETEMFLIYNYLPGGNLEIFIQEKSEKTYDWKVLHKIALHTAKALAYLHDQCRVLHRDVKPSNILLDNNHNAYLSDFGLARLLGTSETHATTGVAGTFGYVAPEYALTCRVSEKSDVYSYGVVLLELISDKKALDPSFSSHEDGFNIVSWACLLLRHGQAKDVFKTGLWNSGPHDKLVDTLHLAVMCTVESLTVRPTMKQVAQRLIQLQPSSS